MEFIKKLFRNKLVSNSAWLFVLQIFNTIVPLITLPYVTRVLGASNYGIFSLSLNWITYLQVIVVFGFGYTGARKVSIHKEFDLQKLYSRIITARVILLLCCYVVITGISLAMHISQMQLICMNILYLMVVGVAFQLNWLFQGKQNMKIITLVNTVARTLSVIAVFLAVKTENHLYAYCLCYSATFMLSAAFGLLYAYKEYGLRLRFSAIPDAIAEMKDAWYLFISQAMSKIFSNVGITVLGFVASEFAIGVYSAIYKIPYVMILFFSPISEALYPYVSVKYSHSMKEGKQTTAICAGIVAIPFILGGCMVILLRKFLIGFIFGEEYLAYVGLTIPFVLWALLSILNNFLGIQYLVASGNQKLYSQASTVGMIINVALNIIKGNIFGVYGVAYAATLGELCLTLLLLLQCLRFNRMDHLKED